MSKEKLNEIGFVRPDALTEEISVKSKPKVDVIRVINVQAKQEEGCPSYVTQYYG